MNETKGLSDTCKSCMECWKDKLKKLDEDIEKVKTTRQEQTGKPYRQQ